ncbi:hypothetical protein OHF15_27500 [Escherichia coli]|uniref:hypothetical protein n=1 Tax=Escherichia coli TaxID=562 RepID=UPI000DD039DD|nr:hypothetical protein [Escherichia coli]MCI5275315.1 hypothetical protein [Escherichia coli]MCI5447730.1 hypothetical protein [Escherichia coli]MCV3046411.1 hypothetical protein [Escherichia coli]MCV8199382.1 hypothetical protein [Escherichia coli]MDN1867520.1 hypothetical protein [Escherichia coli]
MTDFGGKTSIFSHPVYLFLRKFSLQDSRGGSLRKNGAALINFVDARVTDGFILREGEFVTSLQALKEIGIKAGFSAFSGE